jgi:hypothetical protein
LEKQGRACQLKYKIEKMITLPETFLTASLANTGELLGDFLIPIAFVVGSIVLFIVVPRVISWVKKI